MAVFDCSAVHNHTFANYFMCVLISQLTFIDKNKSKRKIWTSFGHEGQE
jgi:hypothetical protein